MVLGVLNLINMFSALVSPFYFIINIYVLFFGFVTLCVETSEEQLKEVPIGEYLAPHLLKIQKLLNEECKFLTLIWGRGVFYFFIGMLMASQCWVCLFFIVGAANMAVGVLMILLHFGISPTEEFLQGIYVLSLISKFHLVVHIALLKIELSLNFFKKESQGPNLCALT